MFNKIINTSPLIPVESDIPICPSLMNLDDMIKQIHLRLGKRTDLQDEILIEIKLAQIELENDVTFNPYFLWRGKDMCVNPEFLDYRLPEGFLRLCEFNNPLFHPETSPFAYELNRGVGNLTYAQDTAVGSPTSFSIQAQNLRLDKRASGVLRLFYITTTTPLSIEAPTNLWTARAYPLLMNKAGLAVARILRDKEAIALFGADYADALFKFKKECVSYEDVGYSLARAEGLFVGLIESVGGWYDPQPV